MGGTPLYEHVPFPNRIVCVCEQTPQLSKVGMGLYGRQCQAASQKVTYLHSLGYALFALCLVYVGHEFKRCRAGQLCALGSTSSFPALTVSTTYSSAKAACVE